VTGLAIIRAILGGQRDPRALATLRDPHCKTDAATIARALEGTWRPEHLFELRQALELVDFYHTQVAACDQEIEASSCDSRTSAGAGPGRRVPPRKARRTARPSMRASTSIAPRASISPGSRGSTRPRPSRCSPRSGST
jgi:hypothetical protein